MPIAVDIDVMPAKRKVSVGELADRAGITPANLAVLKNGRAKAVRFTTLAASGADRPVRSSRSPGLTPLSGATSVDSPLTRRTEPRRGLRPRVGSAPPSANLDRH